VRRPVWLTQAQSKNTQNNQTKQTLLNKHHAPTPPKPNQHSSRAPPG